MFIIVAVIAFVFLFKHFTYSPDTPFTNITVPTSTTEDPFVDLDIDVIGEGASFTSITQGKYPIPNFLKIPKMSTSRPSSHKKAISLFHKEKLIGNRKTKIAYNNKNSNNS